MPFGSNTIKSKFTKYAHKILQYILKKPIEKTHKISASKKGDNRYDYREPDQTDYKGST